MKTRPLVAAQRLRSHRAAEMFVRMVLNSRTPDDFDEAQALLICAALLTVAATAYAARWEMVKRRSPAEVSRGSQHNRLPSSPPCSPIKIRKTFLIDVAHGQNSRSVICQGAHHVEPDSEPTQLKWRGPKQAPIVTYFALAIARPLSPGDCGRPALSSPQPRGLHFQWANEDRPGQRRQTRANGAPVRRFLGGLLKGKSGKKFRRRSRQRMKKSGPTATQACSRRR